MHYGLSIKKENQKTLKNPEEIVKFLHINEDKC